MVGFLSSTMYKKLLPVCPINPFTSRVSYGDNKGDSNFKVCGGNPMCDPSNETSLAVLPTWYYYDFTKMKFGIRLGF